MDPGKGLCEDAGGHCVIQRDGYYIMSFVCVVVGAALLVTYILPTVRKLQCKFLFRIPIRLDFSLVRSSPRVEPDQDDILTIASPMSSWRVKIPR